MDMTFTTLFIWTQALLAVGAQLQKPTFDIDLCALSPPYRLHNQTYGLLTYNSSNDATRYEWCRCSVCDTSSTEAKDETRYLFHVGSVTLTKPGQSLNYTYPHGAGWKVGEWRNNTKEGTFSASLYTDSKCARFTLQLSMAGAVTELKLDFMISRDEVTITCSQKGTDKISDSSGAGLSGREDDPEALDIQGLGIGLGLSAAVVIIAAGGLCVYCKITRSSQNLTSSEADPAVNGVSNPLPSPQGRRDVNTLIIERKRLSMLGYDNVTFTSPSNDSRIAVNTDYEPEHSPTTNSANNLQCQGQDNANFEQEVEEPEYHTLEESHSTDPFHRPESCLPLPEAVEDNEGSFEREREKNGEVIGEEDDADVNHYEEVVVQEGVSEIEEAKPDRERNSVAEEYSEESTEL